LEVSPPLREYAEQKAEKLGKYYDRIRGIEIVVDSRKDAITVEMIVNDEHSGKFLAHCQEVDAYAAVDGCIGKLERQLSEHKKKLRNRKHSGEPNHGLT
jgi:putative sigma-54 modulation protein